MRSERPSPEQPTTIRSPLLFLVLTVGLTNLSVSCRNNDALSLDDTEGRRFEARCSSDRICSVVEAGPVARSGSEGKLPDTTQGRLELRATGRVVGVCGPTRGSPTASDCRPVVCHGDRDCPASEGLSTGVCVGGLCTEPSHAINVDDAVMLCLAGTGVGTQAPQQVERLALGLNCGTPCRIPKPCRQP